MTQRQEHKRRYRKWIILAAVALSSVWCARTLFWRPPFNPAKVARAETQLWQAYYSDDKTKLGLSVIALLRRQYGLSPFEAKEIGELLAGSALAFRSSHGNYESVALPILTKAYQQIRQATGASFDAEKAASAELAWWVARRTQGQNSAEQVGQRIGELYAVLYGRDSPAFTEAGILRAEAAQLRDSGGKHAD